MLNVHILIINPILADPLQNVAHHIFAITTAMSVLG